MGMNISRDCNPADCTGLSVGALLEPIRIPRGNGVKLSCCPLKKGRHVSQRHLHEWFKVLMVSLDLDF